MRDVLMLTLLFTSFVPFTACVNKEEKKKQANINLMLVKAAEAGDYEKTKNLIAKGADVNTRRPGGSEEKTKIKRRGTALMVATMGGF